MIQKLMRMLVLAGCVFLLASCAVSDPAAGEAEGSAARAEASAESGATYRHISQEEARQAWAEDESAIILDVRRQDEFAEGHIPGAICIPNESIGTEPPEELPNLEQPIYVYCRSGRRSKEAAQKLADMGYANVFEFGGILEWTGEIVFD